MDYDRLTQKKLEFDSHRPLAPELARNLEEWFHVELTYTSNAIEGNTLTRRETAIVIEKGLTVGGKSLVEHLEATNHGRALTFVYSLVSKKPYELTAKDVLSIHDIIFQGIDNHHSGQYRTVPVRISGSAVVMPNPRKVPELMDGFQEWLTAKHDLHPVAFAGEAHYRLVTIHPFVDGNGRTARLLMNLLLLMQGYPPAIIRKRDRLAYIASLEKAQLGGSKNDYEKIIARAAERSLDIYMKAIKGKVAELDTDILMQIGDLAKTVGETVPTIRHWTNEGLLEVAEITRSGYHLYNTHMVERVAGIKKLKSERLTLAEIRERLLSV